MRHFAQELRDYGWPVTYAQAENFKTPLIDWIEQHQIKQLYVMTPTDRPFYQLIQKLELPARVIFTPNNRFVWSDEEFKEWASARKRLMMEDFYRSGRRRFDRWGSVCTFCSGFCSCSSVIFSVLGLATTGHCLNHLPRNPKHPIQILGD